MKRFVSDLWEKAINTHVEKMISEGKTEEEIQKIMFETDYTKKLSDFINIVSDDTLKSFETTMFEKVRESEDLDAEFIARNRQKWGKAFVSLKALYEICIEASQYYGEYVDSLELEEKIQKQYAFLAIRELHGRACQMCFEILCLMEHGFVDGAYARWRSLYELVITADFISNNGEMVAKAYYENDNDKDDYKWAKKADCFKGIKPSFNMIRKQSSIPKGIWEQPYQLGNKVVHATAEGTFKRIGNWEGMQSCIPVGSSDYGLSTVGEHTAIMLSIISINFLTIITSIDSLAFAQIVDKWIDVVRKHFFIVAYEKEDKADLRDWLIQNAPDMMAEGASEDTEADAKALKIQKYDNILLKDGREGAVVEILADNELFLVDIGSSPEDWDNIDVRYDEIERVIWSSAGGGGEEES